MTALIYKAALPTYTSAEALNADAGESLLLNEAGTGYELAPAASGGYVPLGSGTGDRLDVGYDSYATTQSMPTNGTPVQITLLDTAYTDGGSTFEWRDATKDVLVLRNCLMQSSMMVEIIPVVVQPITDASHNPLDSPAYFLRMKITPNTDGRTSYHNVALSPMRGPGQGNWPHVTSLSLPFAVHEGDVLRAEAMVHGMSVPLVFDYAEIQLVNLGPVDVGAS